MYWIDHDQQTIEMADKETGAERQRVQRRMPLLINLHAVNHIEPDHLLNHPCAVKNGGCSHLCFATEGGKKRCSCPLHLVLSADAATCIDIPVCPPEKFRCLAGVMCLPDKWRCDGRADCDDMSDETGCESCKANQFRCTNGDCVDASQKCDGTVHCKDGSDEACCQKDKFLCAASNECIAASSLCDGRKDCTDSSDESELVCQLPLSKMHVRFPTQNIGLVVGGILLLGLLIIVVFVIKYRRFCRRGVAKNESGRENMLPSQAACNLTMSSVNGSHQRGVEVSSIPSSSCGISIMSGLPSNSSVLYDRNHVTGASSSSSSRTYPLETLNPPPSPVTVRSQYVQGYCVGSLGSYKHYRSRNKPPPPTPCSTDVCDDSEPGYYYGSEVGYESDPFIPPPPTPRSPYLSDENYELLRSCPHPPPPSPVPANL